MGAIFTSTTGKAKYDMDIYRSSENGGLQQQIDEINEGFDSINNQFAKTWMRQGFEGETNLNNIKTAGWYIMSATGTDYVSYSGADSDPVADPLPFANGTRRILVVSPSSVPGFVDQMMINFDAGAIATRIYASSSWTTWLKSFTSTGMSAVDSDLNNALHGGWYTMGTGTTYAHSPESWSDSDRRVLLVLSGVSHTTQICFRSNIGDVAMRNNYGGSWTSWVYSNNENDSQIVTRYISATDYQSDVTSPNTGIELNVLSYNVAKYNNNTTTYISETKLANFKKLLSKYRPDIIGVQEDNKYLNQAYNSSPTESSIYTDKRLYKPVLPYYVSNDGSGAMVRSRFSQSWGKKMFLSDLIDGVRGDGRITAMTTLFNSTDVLLVCSVHALAALAGYSSSSPESRAARFADYENLFAWISGERTLTEVSSAAAISCPSWKWCVICGDFNTPEVQRDALLQLADDYNMTPANGGWLGWFNTGANNTNRTWDNVLVSSNVTINAVEVPEYLAAELYSDHCPLYANLTLRDEEHST